MELSKYIEAIKAALNEKLMTGIATVDAIMTSEGNLHGGCVAINGQQVSLGNRLPIANLDDGVRVRFSINLA